jgi:hypothetical protein
MGRRPAPAFPGVRDFAPPRHRFDAVAFVAIFHALFIFS